MTGARAYLAGVVALCALPAIALTYSAMDGGVQSAAQAPDVVWATPSRAEPDALAAGQQVTTGADAQSVALAGGWGVPVSTPVVADYTGTELVIPYALWIAVVAHFPEGDRVTAIRIAYCESRYRADATNAEGARGVFQVIERYHGPVPGDVEGQTAQAARIHRAQGWAPWDCA